MRRYRIQFPLLAALWLCTPQIAASNFCASIPRAPVGQPVKTIQSGNVKDLLWQVRTASPGTTLQLDDGVYRLAANQSLEVSAPGVTIRSLSGNREAVMIEGGYNNVSINSDDVTIADITLRKPSFHNVQVRGEKGILRTRIYNVHLLDAGQQLIKVSTGDGLSGKFADDGLVACSLIEYTTYSRGTASTAPSYTDGVDILAGKGWVIRDNIFRRIRSPAGPAGPAILVWKNAQETLVQRNTIVDSWRGIALGLMSPNKNSRGGAEVIYDHQNGVVEDNVILALTERADAAIENNYAANSRVRHNTVYYNPKIRHAVNWSIEYRFAPTTVVIKNNLTNLPIIKRQPLPEQEAVLAGNVTNVQESWFRDTNAGDVRLMPDSPARGRGVPLDASDRRVAPDRQIFSGPPDPGAYE